jgi:hypothetical protein
MRIVRPFVIEIAESEFYWYEVVLYAKMSVRLPSLDMPCPIDGVLTWICLAGWFWFRGSGLLDAVILG